MPAVSRRPVMKEASEVSGINGTAPTPVARTVPVDTGLVIVEFAGLGADQSFARALPDRPADRVVTLDPLAQQGADRSQPLARRAWHLGEAVRAAGLQRVALVAACTGAALLAPMAAELARRGISVTCAVAVDPQVVTDRFLQVRLSALADKLAGTTSDTTDRVRAILDAWDEHRAVRLAEELFTWSLGTYVRTAEPDRDEAEILRTEVLPRYTAWAAFLLDMRSAPSAATLPRVHVLTSGDESAAEELFGSGCGVCLHRFRTDGVPGLVHEPLGAELRTVLEGAYR